MITTIMLSRRPMKSLHCHLFWCILFLGYCKNDAPTAASLEWLLVVFPLDPSQWTATITIIMVHIIFFLEKHAWLWATVNQTISAKWRMAMHLELIACFPWRNSLECIIISLWLYWWNPKIEDHLTYENSSVRLVQPQNIAILLEL